MPQPTGDKASGTTAPSADRLVPVRPSPKDRAAELLRDVLNRPTDGALAGTEVTLYQVVADPTGPPRRAALIRAYWQLSAAVADYHDALAAQRRLEQLAQVAPALAGEIAADQFKLELATAEVRVAATRLAAVGGQHQLGQLRPDLTMTALPLPADRPHTGGYRTLYDQIFAGQIVPAARRLNETLPLAHDLIAARAAAVDAADRLLTLATDRLKAGRGTVTEVLDCDRQLVAQQQALISSIRDYNLAIAEYAQLVAPDGSNPARLVAMLIKTHDGPARERPGAAGGMPTEASGAPTAAGEPPTAPAAVPATPGRLPVDGDGMISILKQRPVARRQRPVAACQPVTSLGRGSSKPRPKRRSTRGEPRRG